MSVNNIFDLILNKMVCSQIEIDLFQFYNKIYMVFDKIKEVNFLQKKAIHCKIFYYKFSKFLLLLFFFSILIFFLI